ncbi:hypothetical protein Hanom_Chr12g01151721 [Helianthus anomalus]
MCKFEVDLVEFALDERWLLRNRKEVAPAELGFGIGEKVLKGSGIYNGTGGGKLLVLFVGLDMENAMFLVIVCLVIQVAVGSYYWFVKVYILTRLTCIFY